MAFKEGKMRFKVGDLVRSMKHPELLGCVLKSDPTATSIIVKVHWFHPETQKPVLVNPCFPLKSDLEKVNESR